MVWGRRFFVVVSFLILTLSLIGVSSADSDVVDFSSVSLNGVDISDSGSVHFSVERGSKLDVVMAVSSSMDIDRLEFQAVISGFSLNDVSGKGSFSSRSVSNLRSSVSYPVSFSFDIPQGVDVGDYSVSISVWDRSGIVQSFDIPFVVSAGSHSVGIKDILLGSVSSGSVIAGDDVIVSARLENSGLSDENVRVEFVIPSLNISSVVFVDDFKSGSIVTSSDAVLSIPYGASAGEYIVSVIASFRDGRQSVSDSVLLTVIGSDSNVQVSNSKSNVPSTTSQISNPEFLVSLDLPKSIDSIRAGKEFSFSVRVSNTDIVDRSFKLSIVGGDSVGDVFVRPSSVVIPSMSSVFVSVDGVVDDDAFGERIFFVKVSSLDNSISYSVPVSVDIMKSSWVSIRNVLEVVFIILVVVLLCFVFFVAWRNDWF